ncbi:MAG: MAPEG family protein [Alcanivoracaceae bacterium]|nr:MAPEG family protein [Alcanivoracaceae bacterium]
MKYTIIIILIALLQYLYFIFKVGFNRVKYKVSAPKISGDDIWERMFRVQQNTLEQLIIFIPAMIAFATYVSEKWVLIPGIVFLIGRALYSYLYISKPESRSPGFALSIFSNVALVIGSLIGIIINS